MTSCKRHILCVFPLLYVTNSSFLFLYYSNRFKISHAWLSCCCYNMEKIYYLYTDMISQKTGLQNKTSFQCSLHATGAFIFFNEWLTDLSKTSCFSCETKHKHMLDMACVSIYKIGLSNLKQVAAHIWKQLDTACHKSHSNSLALIKFISTKTI